MNPRLSTLAVLGATVSIVVACGGGGSSDTSQTPPSTPASVDTTLRSLLAANQVSAPARPTQSDAQYSLGLNLFTSTLLSGNQKVACSSCHPIGNAGVDNQPLAIGVNGTGSRLARIGTPQIPRNTPDLLNKTVGSRQFMFWDGRVSYQNGAFHTPAGDKLPSGLESVVAAQALFPMVSRDEMLGYYDTTDTNELADLVAADVAVDSNPQPVWNGIMTRLRANPAMAAALTAAYPDVRLEDMGIQHVANAIAAYESRRWYGFGNTNVLMNYVAGTVDISDSAKRGGVLFFDKAGCARCHTGPLLSDQKFHNLAVPQIGPGAGSGQHDTPVRDKGRYEVTHDDADLYAFLTPSLWEVQYTFPYFHNGVYSTLDEVVRHHLDATNAARNYRCSGTLTAGGSAVACRDSTSAGTLYEDMIARLDEKLRAPITLTDAEIADLIAFLQVLTDGNNVTTR